MQASRTPAPKCSYVSKAKGRIGKGCKQLAIGGGGAMLCTAHNCPFPGCHDGKASAAEHCDAHASSSLAPSNGMYGFAVSAPSDNMYAGSAPNTNHAATASSDDDERFDGSGFNEPELAPTYGMNVSAASAPAYGMNLGQPGDQDQLTYDVLAPAAGAYEC